MTPKVGETYSFVTKWGRSHTLTGRVIELVEDGSVARVEATEPANLATMGEHGLQPGDVVRVYLPLLVPEEL